MKIEVSTVNSSLKNAVRRIEVANIHEAKSVAYGVNNVDMVAISIYDKGVYETIKRHPKIKGHDQWTTASYSKNEIGDRLLKRFKKASYMK